MPLQLIDISISMLLNINLNPQRIPIQLNENANGDKHDNHSIPTDMNAIDTQCCYILSNSSFVLQPCECSVQTNRVPYHVARLQVSIIPMRMEMVLGIDT